jgi:hypothetical protein
MLYTRNDAIGFIVDLRNTKNETQKTIPESRTNPLIFAPEMSTANTSPELLEKSVPVVNLSSNATLFWRIFVPVFGTVFMTGLLLVFWLIDEDALYTSFPILWTRLGITAFWAGWLLLIYRTVWRLKRMDANATHFFATNYWTTARYQWSDLAEITETKRLGRSIMHFRLRQPGFFGSTISFLPGSTCRKWLREQNIIE